MPGAVPKLRTHHTDTSPKTRIKNLPNYEYVGNYYWKDFKYISPEGLQRIERTRNIVAPLKANMEEGTCKLFTRLWFAEVIKGLKQFLYEGSLHGVKYIFEPTFSRKEKLIWIIIVVISVAICAVNIIQLLCKWHSKPFVNVIDSLPTPIWAIPFPTVVLCPHLHVQLSYANVSKLDEREYFFASLVCPQLSHEKIALSHPLNTEENIMMQDFIVKGSPKCTDIVKSCYWKSTHDTEWFSKECCEKMFKPIFTDYGLCFAFNSLPLNSLTNDSLRWQKTFNPNASQLPLKWSLDDGYPKVFPPDPTMIPFRAMASGEVHGLGVELYLNTSEHQFGCDGNNVGFNVLINSPTDSVYTSNVIRLPMNKMTTIKVTPITYKTDAELRALPPYQRQCYFQDERKLKYYEFYTDSNCKHDLWMREVKKQCNCVLFNWPTKVEEHLTYAYFEDSQEERTRVSASASCHPACNDILYSSQVFYSDLVSIPGPPEPDWEFKEGEVTRINVHFYGDIFLGQHRHTQYDDYYFADTDMFSQDALYGFTDSLSQLRSLSDKLNAEVVEQVNNTQELVMKNNFMKESNEYLLKKCLQERISDVASWRWVLDDLAKRLEDSIDALKHESDALYVVVQRIDYEVNAATSYVAKPGALSPLMDQVEEAIIQELAFLREEKERFEGMIIQINKQIVNLEKTKKRIEDDAFNKHQAISVDEACCHNDHNFVDFENNKKKKPKKSLSLIRWEKRCSSLKEAGINALRHAIITRQRIRAARVQLSITAQAYGIRVDSALRRRLHSNIIKLQDLDWQRGEVIRDFQSLENELTTTEKSVLDTMDRQKTVQGRLAERTLRPFGEHASDGVNRQLRNELGKLRKFIKELRANIQMIISLQNHLRGAIAHIDCSAEDIAQVIKIDQERLRTRLGDDTETNENATNTASSPQPRKDSSERQMVYPLDVIKEEDESDPF